MLTSPGSLSPRQVRQLKGTFSQTVSLVNVDQSATHIQRGRRTGCLQQLDNHTASSSLCRWNRGRRVDKPAVASFKNKRIQFETPTTPPNLPNVTFSHFFRKNIPRLTL